LARRHNYNLYLAHILTFARSAEITSCHHQGKWTDRKRQLTHSSRTKNRQADRSSLPVEMRSSRRPGVPTTISTYQQ